MSYTLTLSCGCVVFVVCQPETRIATSRVIKSRGKTCQIRRHHIGVHLFLWEILPDKKDSRGLIWFND
jgi:hypothetical protein